MKKCTKTTRFHMNNLSYIIEMQIDKNRRVCNYCVTVHGTEPLHDCNLFLNIPGKEEEQYA